ncbi:hypothetical protein [Stenomitos frigidus]|uniref:Uncharacterized protein n=1 Tax=Stenomitos frigidus ULC18 TaxID=2107698 RepID=A0A2T1E1B2_9CYAN|nr:hypothetical protein [Stenomitos frigidus]PSB26491.1 hypothetical protein C7B82_19670 [Stenomitos frigidus ULC18]
MLPLVINEEQIFAFNFWLNGSIRCGMHHESEFYCRLASFDIQKRPQVYQLGCKLAQQQTAIVLSSTADTCSLWGSLRDPSIKRILLAGDTSNLLIAMLLQMQERSDNQQPCE